MDDIGTWNGAPEVGMMDLPNQIRFLTRFWSGRVVGLRISSDLRRLLFQSDRRDFALGLSFGIWMEERSWFLQPHPQERLEG